MPAVLNTNMASLYAQKNLSTAQADLATSVQRLSSGKRINSAKDDAAGFAVAEAVAATKNITDQSIRNAQDAISLLQTAEGGLDVVGKILQRVLTLTTQRENSSLTSTQTNSINDEINTLLGEVSKIKSRTRFQGGADSIYGTSQTFTTGSGTSSPTQTNVEIADLSLSALGAVSGSALASSAVSTGTVGKTIAVGALGAAVAAGSRVLVNGIDTGLTVTANAAQNATSVAISSAYQVKQGDVMSFYAGRLGNEVTVEDGNNSTGKTLTLPTVNAAVAAGSKVYVNGVDTGRTVSAGAASSATNFTVSANLAIAVGDKVSFYSANSEISSSSSSADITSAIQKNIVNRAKLGASQLQLNYVVDNMQTLSNNLADAKSRIVDTDYAAETSALTRGQILQQAATSMLAQANQMPNVILTLLK